MKYSYNFISIAFLLFVWASTAITDETSTVISDTTKLDSVEISKIKLDLEQIEKNNQLKNLDNKVETIDQQIVTLEKKTEETMIEREQLNELLGTLDACVNKVEVYEELIGTYKENETEYELKINKLDSIKVLLKDKEHIWKLKENDYKDTLTDLERHYKKEKIKKKIYKTLTFVASPLLFIAGFLVAN